MKSKAKKYIEYLDCGIFPIGVALLYNQSIEDARNHFSKSKQWDWFAGLAGEEKFFEQYKNFALKSTLEESTGRKETKELYYIVLNQPFTRKNIDYVIIAHEVLHLCQFILPKILDRNKEIEAEAYLHSHLMTQILNIIS